MIISARNYATLASALMTLLMTGTPAHAACSRDDVEFYLQKGFTTEQITELCRSAPTSAAPAETAPAAQPEESVQQASTGVADDELFLRTAIKADDVYLSNEALHYTWKKMCFEYDEEDLYGFAPKVCPDVKFVIALKGLEVLDSGQRYGFYGPNEVKVRSKINREIIGNLEDQKPGNRERILAAFEKGDETAIQIRSDISLERVKQVLQKLAE